MTELTKLEIFSKDIFTAAFGRWQPPDAKATFELVKWSVNIAKVFLTHLDETQQEQEP